jgi:hypothetical protein
METLWMKLLGLHPAPVTLAATAPPPIRHLHPTPLAALPRPCTHRTRENTTPRNNYQYITRRPGKGKKQKIGRRQVTDHLLASQASMSSSAQPKWQYGPQFRSGLSFPTTHASPSQAALGMLGSAHWQA